MYLKYFLSHETKGRTFFKYIRKATLRKFHTLKIKEVLLLLIITKKSIFLTNSMRTFLVAKEDASTTSGT